MADMTPQEANAAGLNWVPKNHPSYGKPGFVGSTPAAAPAPGTNPVAAPTGATTVQGQATAAQTYSNTPGSAPVNNTTNQGTQDVVRNSYLQQATQGTTVDQNAPEFKQQVDAFNAGQQRSQRDYESQQAERLSAQGLGNSGAMDIQRRMAAEKAGQNMGAFQSQLVQRELENKRSEIQDALTHLGGMLTSDQQMKLQRDLADLEAQLKREGLAQSGELGNRDISLRDKLGTGALNVDLMRALLQNQQFNKGQALDWSQFDWMSSPMNPQNWG